MQLEMLGGSFDYVRLNEVTQQLIASARQNPGMDRTLTTFQSDARMSS